MKKTDAGTLLKEVILVKEAELKLEGELLKEHFHLAYESLKPVNIIKNAFKGMFSAPDMKTNLVNGAVGLASGFAAKKVFIGKSHNPLTKLAGFILEMIVASSVTKNADGIRSIGNSILKKIINRHSDPVKT